jgi:hypothetical protein
MLGSQTDTVKEMGARQSTANTTKMTEFNIKKQIQEMHIIRTKILLTHP